MDDLTENIDAIKSELERQVIGYSDRKLPTIQPDLPGLGGDVIDKKYLEDYGISKSSERIIGYLPLK